MGFCYKEYKGRGACTWSREYLIAASAIHFFSRTRISPYFIKEKFGTLQAQKQTVRYRELEQHTNEKTDKAHEVVDYIG